jgi:hypothetical protein
VGKKLAMHLRSKRFEVQEGQTRLQARLYLGQSYRFSLEEDPLGLTCVVKNPSGQMLPPGPTVNVECEAAPVRADLKDPPMFSELKNWKYDPKMTFNGGIAASDKDGKGSLHSIETFTRPVRVEITLRPNGVYDPFGCMIMQAFPKDPKQRYSGYSFGVGFGPQHVGLAVDNKRKVCRRKDRRATAGATYIPFGDWSTYRLDIKADGTVALYIDGDYVCSIEDSKYQSGVIGVASGCRGYEVRSIKATPITTPDVIGLWRFEEPKFIGMDSSTYGNHLRKFGTGKVRHRTSLQRHKIGNGGIEVMSEKGMAYFAIDKKSSLPNGIPTKSASFSFSAWVRRTSDSNKYGTILNWGSPKGRNGLSVHDAFKGFRASISPSPFIWRTPNGRSMSKWRHVAVTYDRVTGKHIMYINGEKAVEEVVKKKFVKVGRGPGKKKFNLGRRKGGGEFTGLLDDVAIFDGALTPGDIKNVMVGDYASFSISKVDCSKAGKCGKLNRRDCRWYDNQCGPCRPGFRELDKKCFECKSKGKCFKSSECCQDMECVKETDLPNVRGECMFPGKN